jgi:UDP-N-acetyl-D-glucosamine dehydrogenase
MQELLRRIAERSAHVVVVGIGYVGLPLVAEFSRAGFRVTGLDSDPRKVTALNAGESYIADVETRDIAPHVQSGRLRATTDPSVLAEADAVVVCVPTPLNKTRDPDMRYIVAATAEIARYQHRDMLVVLESTTYPGTTSEVMVPKLTQTGFELGQSVFVAFSPERVDPGNQVYKTRNTPKVLGGATPACLQVATALYSQIIEQLVPVSSTETAEMVKLLENTFRAVNIGLVNEVAIMSRKLGIDPFEVIRAAATKPFGFMPFYPGPGLGGHCIPIDPL